LDGFAGLKRRDLAHSIILVNMIFQRIGLQANAQVATGNIASIGDFERFQNLNLRLQKLLTRQQFQVQNRVGSILIAV